MNKLLKAFDAKDLFFAVGFGLVTAGIWREVSMNAAFFCAGGILLYTALRK